MCIFCRNEVKHLLENEVPEVDVAEGEVTGISEGDGKEGEIQLPETDDWGFEIDGNKMTKIFPWLESQGDLGTRLEVLDNLKAKMAKFGLGLTYNLEHVKTTTKKNERTGNESIVHMYKCTAEYTSPIFKENGYEYILTLEHSDQGNFVFPTLEHKDENFERYYNGVFTCSHCGVDRLRNSMHVFRKDGEDFIFGTSCAKRYFGIKFIDKIRKAIIDVFAAMSSLGYSDEDEDYRGGSGAGNPTVSSYFPYAYMIISNAPYWRKATEGQMSTPMEINWLWHPSDKSRGEAETFKEKFYDRNDKDSVETFYKKMKDEFESFLSFYQNMKVENEFQQNLKASALTEFVKKEGLIAYAIFHWYVTSKGIQKKEKEELAESNYIGNVGDKLIFAHVTLLKLIPYSTQFGDGLIHIMVSKGDVMPFVKPSKKDSGMPSDVSNKGKGDRMVWYTSSDSKMEQGKSYTISATVNKQDEYKGVKQTVVKLVKVLAPVE